MLERLEIENYKSLHEVALDVPPFATVVGANAAGKSNFADALEFLSIVAKSGLPTAVTDKGGYENICFRRARRAKGAIRFYLKVTGLNFVAAPHRPRDYQFGWGFAFKAVKQTISSEFAVQSEQFTVSERKSLTSDPWSQVFAYRYPDEHGKPSMTPSKEGEYSPFIPSKKFLESVLANTDRSRTDDLALTTHLRPFPLFRWFLDQVASAKVFQIMPVSARRPASASGTRELSKNGENLPAALEGLRKYDKKAYETLLEYLRLAVPTVEELQTGYVETRELGLFLKEQGIRRRQFASELSDGTLRTIAIFLPLVDPRYKLVVIEEPENSIHPWVIRHFVQACRERSSEKQIILTTHSPVLVSCLKPKELFIAERRDGQSEIMSAPSVGKEVDEIIRKGIMNLGSYWDSGAMRAVPARQSEFFNKLKDAE